MKASGESPVRGVAVIIADPQTHRLLVLHRVLHWSGWEFVKGHRDADETPAAAARREVKEETSLDLITITPLSVHLRFTAADGERRYDCFLGTAEGGRVTTGPEHDGYRWVALDEARALLTPAHQPPLEAAADTLSDTP